MWDHIKVKKKKNKPAQQRKQKNKNLSYRMGENIANYLIKG